MRDPIISLLPARTVTSPKFQKMVLSKLRCTNESRKEKLPAIEMFTCKQKMFWKPDHIENGRVRSTRSIAIVYSIALTFHRTTQESRQCEKRSLSCKESTGLPKFSCIWSSMTLNILRSH